MILLLFLSIQGGVAARPAPPTPQELNAHVRALMADVDSANTCAVLDDALHQLMGVSNFIGESARAVEVEEQTAGWTAAQFTKVRRGIPRVVQVAAYNLARCHWEEGALPEAAQRFEQALSLMPAVGPNAEERAEVHAQIGEVRSGLREWESAARHFSAAAKIHPESAALLANLGAALLNRAMEVSGASAEATTAEAATASARAYARVVALRPHDAAHALRDRVQLAMALALVPPNAADPFAAAAWARSVEQLEQTLTHLRAAAATAAAAAAAAAVAEAQSAFTSDAHAFGEEGAGGRVAGEAEVQAEAAAAAARNEEHTLLVFATLVLETSLRRSMVDAHAVDRRNRLNAIAMHLERCMELEQLAATKSSAQQLASTVYRLGRVYRSLERAADEQALYATAVDELHIWRHAEQRPAYMFAFPRVEDGHNSEGGGEGLIATPWWRGVNRTRRVETSDPAPSTRVTAEEDRAGVEARVAEAVRLSPLRSALRALEAAHADVRAEIAALLPSIVYGQDAARSATIEVGAESDVGAAAKSKVNAAAAKGLDGAELPLTDLDDEGVADAGQWRKLVLARDGRVVAPPRSLEPLLKRLAAAQASASAAAMERTESKAAKAARVLTPLEAWGLLMPKTSSLVREVLRNCSARLPRGSVEFSVLAPGAHLRSHCGPTNHRLRVHLPLLVPRTESSCGALAAARCATHALCVACGVAHMRVGLPHTLTRAGEVGRDRGCSSSSSGSGLAAASPATQCADEDTASADNGVRSWVEGRATLFDDSFEHEVWNPSIRPRVVLLIDVWHPQLLANPAAQDAVREHFWAGDSTPPPPPDRHSEHK